MSKEPHSDRSDSAGRSARAALLVGIAATVALYVLPGGQWVARPLVYLSTFVHEMGHGIAALLVGGSFSSFQMWSDGSGIAHITAPSGHLASAFVSAGGLVGPAVCGALLFLFARHRRLARLALFGLAAFFLVADVLVVRTLFGLVFAGVVGVLFLFAALKLPSDTAQAILVFTGVQLALSVYSDRDYLFTDTAHTAGGKLPSDVANMATALFPPYWLWGIVCGAFSVAVLGLGLWLFLRRSARPANR